MEKVYTVTFGSGDPRTNTGLTPSFDIFQTTGGTALTAPAIAEVGAATGFYSFTYGMTVFGVTVGLQFLIDGGAGLSDSDRYVTGVLDPLASVDQIAGYTADSFGNTLTDPSSLFGFAKRFQEWLEGDAVYNKSTTTWDVYSRGASTLLREKTLTNNSSQATKT